MRDSRMDRLADVLVGHSCSVQPGERVLIDAFDIPDDMTCALVERVAQAGGLPFVNTISLKVRRSVLLHSSEEQMKVWGDADLALMTEMNCYIAIRGGGNLYETSDVPHDKMQIARHFWQTPALDRRLEHTKWVILRWPTASMAQTAGMSTEQFEDYFFNICTLDYARMAKAEEALKERMERADIVRIIGPGETNLTLSIKGMPAVSCVGDRNIPDGEVFTAPIRDSVNGVILFNAGTTQDGKPFEGVRLSFKDGRIVEATASDTRSLNRILDSDEGARYIGEFSFGFNPYITRVMRDALFDEKIAGSIHLTPGSAYGDADNGNRSRIHWDLVLMQGPEHGGGEVWFDDELIRKDGRFVPQYLQCLNPEALV